MGGEAGGIASEAAATLGRLAQGLDAWAAARASQLTLARRTQTITC